jgi:hypothetical protein
VSTGIWGVAGGDDCGCGPAAVAAVAVAARGVWRERRHLRALLQDDDGSSVVVPTWTARTATRGPRTVSRRSAPARKQEASRAGYRQQTPPPAISCRFFAMVWCAGRRPRGEGLRGRRRRVPQNSHSQDCRQWKCRNLKRRHLRAPSRMPNLGNSKRQIFAIGLDETHTSAIYQMSATFGIAFAHTLLSRQFYVISKFRFAIKCSHIFKIYIQHHWSLILVVSCLQENPTSHTYRNLNTTICKTNLFKYILQHFDDDQVDTPELCSNSSTAQSPLNCFRVQKRSLSTNQGAQMAVKATFYTICGHKKLLLVVRVMFILAGVVTFCANIGTGPVSHNSRIGSSKLLRIHLGSHPHDGLRVFSSGVEYEKADWVLTLTLTPAIS